MMNLTRRYLPLILFVVPNVIVAYAVVIPRSCIAGMNELTVGFAVTLLGACFTYVAGQRAVAASGTVDAASWPQAILRALNRQAAAPRGCMGRILGVIWRYEHAKLNRDVMAALDIEPGHRVLELGCGPGHALAEAARLSRPGLSVGVDVSALMVQMASRRTRREIARGEVIVQHGDAMSLEFEPSGFDRIYAVHSIYFWRDPALVIRNMADALRLEGKLVLAFRPESDQVPARFRDDTYRFPRVEEVRAWLESAGLVVRRTELRTDDGAAVVVAVRSQSA